MPGGFLAEKFLEGDYMRFCRGLVKIIDSFLNKVGNLSQWIVIPLMLLLVFEVVTRRIFGRPHLWTNDVAKQIFSLYFLLYLGVGILKDVHVRIDLFYERFSKRKKALFDLVTYPVMVIIPSVLMLNVGAHYAATSWARHQLTPSICRIPIYPIKTFIPVAFALILLAAVSKFIKDLSIAVKGREL